MSMVMEARIREVISGLGALEGLRTEPPEREAQLMVLQ